MNSAPDAGPDPEHPTPAGIPFSPRQAGTIATALTALATAVVIAFCGTLAWLAARFLMTFSGVWVPILTAGVLSLLLKPYYRWLHERRGLGPALSVAVVMLSTILPLLVLMGFSGVIIFHQVGVLITKIPGWYESIAASAAEHLPTLRELWDEYQIGEKVTAFVETNAGEMAVRLQEIFGTALKAGLSASSWLGSLFGWLLLPAYLAFFLTLPPCKPEDLESGLPFLRKETRANVVFLVTEFMAILVTFFRGQLLVALAQGVLYAVGFWAVGLEFGFAIGFVLGLLNIVPYLGNIIGLGVALPTAYFQDGGGWILFGLTLGVFAIVQVLESMLLTPKIMGKRTGLHPVAIIIAIMFWGVALDGIVGMILAIPLTAFLVVVWRLLREKYIREIL